MIEIEAIDMFVESDPEAGDDDEGLSLISLRVPSDREFARQIKELGAKWDDAAKEWRLVGSEDTIKQIGALCKAVFPELPRRRNRLVALQVSSTPGNWWDVPPGPGQSGPTTRQVETITRVEFVVNRTIKTYRRGQNLGWVKEWRDIAGPGAASPAGGQPGRRNPSNRERELEQTATQAFEALLTGRKEAVAAILKEAGIEQL